MVIDGFLVDGISFARICQEMNKFDIPKFYCLVCVGLYQRIRVDAFVNGKLVIFKDVIGKIGCVHNLYK